MQEKKRKGYATQEQQNAANRRYYRSSEEAKQKTLYASSKSHAKNFILKRATADDLNWLKGLILEREKNI
ncbi:hypothetical protein P7J64_07360 [Streptococcus suis]|uniref:hypothetical protein n=2 Tax=Streptococcus suis TaxID=1307 RepID=UPI000CF59444|nr:hypothetical protein [Streptococcus suis]NQR20644.1 hypothetical protein [Streptococcus suis]HEM5318580.1 hypothetical protein [Streptococcus suis]HEM5651178.1 hypothetical protein [Streptococcus suis]